MRFILIAVLAVLANLCHSQETTFHDNLPSDLPESGLFIRAPYNAAWYEKNMKKYPYEFEVILDPDSSITSESLLAEGNRYEMLLLDHRISYKVYYSYKTPKTSEKVQFYILLKDLKTGGVYNVSMKPQWLMGVFNAFIKDVKNQFE